LNDTVRSRPDRDAPLPAVPGRTPEPAWANALAIGLALIFLATWLAPPLTALHGVEIMPIWLHTVMETFAIAISLMIFGVVWNSHARERAGSLVILACAFLAAGLIDIAHTLSYRGMPDFVTAAGPEKAINFWLAARLAVAAGLLAIALRAWPPIASERARVGMLAGTLALIGGVWWLGLFQPGLWPRTFIEGQGLTAFKVGMEYLIVAVMVLAMILLRRRREDMPEAGKLILATFVTILGELCFTLYSNVTDLMNLLGHVYKVIAYAFFYRAVFVHCVREPFQRLEAEIDVRHAAERALTESIRYREALLARLPAAVVVHGADGTVQYCNEEALRLLGVDASAIEGKPVNSPGWRFLDEDGAPIPVARYPVSQVQASLAPLHGFVGGIVHAEGEPPLWVQVNAFPYFDADGRVEHIVASFVDITERKRTKDELRTARDRLEQIIDVSPAAIYRVELSATEQQPARVGFLSHQIVELTGHTLADWRTPGF